MTRLELLDLLRGLRDYEPEAAHGMADEALVEYIGDAEIAAAFDAVPKWYA